MKSNFELVYDFNKLFGRDQLEPLKDICEDSEQQKLKSQLALIKEEVSELEQAIEDGDWEELKDAVMDILVVTYGMGYVCDIDCDKGVAEVNRANMSKACITKQEVEQTVQYYNELGISCTITARDGKFLVKSSDNQTDTSGKYYPQGKFLKNINWSEPDLGFIEM